MKGWWGFGGGGFEGKRKEKKLEREAMDGSGWNSVLSIPCFGLLMELFFFLKPNSFSHSQVCELETSLDGIILSIYLSLSLLSVDKFPNPKTKRLPFQIILFLVFSFKN